MITRHFYRLDEVRAALLYAIMRGRPLETAFWIQELVDTGLYKQAWAALVEGWLWFSLATDPNWIADIRLGTTMEDLHLAAYRLCTNSKDNSLWATLLTSSQTPDTLCANVPVHLPYSKPCLERFLSLALFQRKGAAACWAAHRLGKVQLPASCQVVPAVMAACGLDQPLVSLSAQVLLVCSRTEGRPSAPMPADLVAAIRSWTGLVGRKGRRLLAVPQECLYGLTERGRLRQTETTVHEFRRMDDRILEETEGFWPAAFAPYRNGSGWVSDDAHEAFYAAYFPDDIPDEWSGEELAKSHGSGLLRSLESASLQRLGRIWCQAESRFVWGFYEWPADLEETGDATDFCHAAHYLNAHHEDIVTALLDPVRKLLLVE